jgi:ABC-type thiamin/hydroxymethylpyrimidine transport system permease subunit
MGNRIVEIAFGVFFISLSAAIFFYSDNGMAYLAALFVGGLGAEVIFSAIRGRRSLLSRIGPLP